MEKAKARGSNQHQEWSHDATAPRILADPGISKNQSSRWQQLAEVPEDQFEAALAGPDKPSTTSIIERSKVNPAAQPMCPKALWVWGRLRDFERDAILEEEPAKLLTRMALQMREDAMRFVPLVAQGLEGLCAR